VCALFPNISASARKSAITEINSAIFLFLLSPTGFPRPPCPCSSCSMWCSTSCWTACTPWLMSPLRASLADDVSNRPAYARGARSPSRVGVAVIFHEPLGVHRGVDLGGGQGGMAQQLLDRAQIAAARQQMRRERMAQRMRGRGIRQPERAAQPRHRELDDAR